MSKKFWNIHHYFSQKIEKLRNLKRTTTLKKLTKSWKKLIPESSPKTKSNLAQQHSAHFRDQTGYSDLCSSKILSCCGSVQLLFCLSAVVSRCGFVPVSICPGAFSSWCPFSKCVFVLVRFSPELYWINIVS